MVDKKEVKLGMVGAGYAAQLHCNGYARVSGVDVKLHTICDSDEKRGLSIKEKYGFEYWQSDFDEMLKNPEIDIVDICTPPMIHKAMIIKSLKAGKNVFCEKPLLGYFGQPGDEIPIGKTVSKEKMYQFVLTELDELKEAVETSGKYLAYAENYVYAPSVQKSLEIMQAKKSRILFMKGEESLRGSSSALAGEWSGTGGGSLIRVGCHPLGGILYLKQAEAKYRGANIKMESIIADMGQITLHLKEEEKSYHTIRPNDVEDFANLTITFTDGSKAVILASDVVLGGTKNYVEIYANNGTFMCNLTPTDSLNVYMMDDVGMEGISFSEMLPSARGWNKAFVADEILRGYTDELKDFVESVAYNKEPLSNFQVAYDTTKAMYAAYWSAETGKKIMF